MMMMKTVVVVLSALAMAGVANAFLPSACSQTSASFSYVSSATCYLHTISSAGDTVTIPFDSDIKLATVYVWNSAKDASFAAGNFALTYADGSTVAGMGTVTGVGAEFAVYWTFDPTNKAPVTLTTTFAVNKVFGVTVQSSAQPNAFVPTVSAESSFRYRILPGVDTPQYLLTADYIKNRFAVQSVSVTVTETTGNAAAGTFTAAVAPAPGGTVTTSLSGSVRTTTWTTVSQPAFRGGSDWGFQPDLTLTMSNLASPDYDWATLGPEFEGTIMFTVTEYPTLTSELTLGAGTHTYVSENPVLFKDVTYTASAPITVDSRFDDPTTGTAATPSATTISTPMTYSSFALTAPLRARFNTKVFTTFVTTADHTRISASVNTFAGECSSYTDCVQDSGDHPSPRGSLSANGDVERFKQCLMVPSAADPTVPTGRCVECLNDCDCMAGQYCHTDPGVCDLTGSNAFYTCDSFSRARLGVCIAKDPTGDIIGQTCRNTFKVGSATRMPTTVDPSTAAVSGITIADYMSDSTANGLVLVDGGVVVDDLPQTGAGFCGRARYYNASSVDTSASVASSAVLNNGARAILWQGICANGICQECLGAGETCAGAQQCIDGKSAQTIVVDGTSRTFSNNTLASTMLAAVLMIIILQLCVCCRIFQARKYRKQDQMAEMVRDGTAPKIVF